MDMHQALTALQHGFPQLHISSALPTTQGRDNFVLEINIGHDPTFWQRLDFYLDFYVRFYSPYTEAFKATQSQDHDTLAEQIYRIQSTLES